MVLSPVDETHHVFLCFCCSRGFFSSQDWSCHAGGSHNCDLPCRWPLCCCDFLLIPRKCYFLMKFGALDEFAPAFSIESWQDQSQLIARSAINKASLVKDGVHDGWLEIESSIDWNLVSRSMTTFTFVRFSAIMLCLDKMLCSFINDESTSQRLSDRFVIVFLPMYGLFILFVVYFVPLRLWHAFIWYYVN